MYGMKITRLSNALAWTDARPPGPPVWKDAQLMPQGMGGGGGYCKTVHVVRKLLDIMHA